MPNNIKWGSLILLCAPILLAHAQPKPLTTSEQTTLISLEPLQLIQQALQVNPSMLAAQNEIQAAALEQQAIQRQRYLSPSAQAQFTKDTRSAKVVIEQPLWTAGRLTSAQEKAALDYKASIESEQAQRYKIASNVLEVWGLLLDTHQRMQVATDTLKELEQFAQMMKRRVETGVSAQVELDLVDSRILQTQVTYNNAQQMMRLGWVRLSQLTGDYRLIDSNVVLPQLDTLSEQFKNSYHADLLKNKMLGNAHPLVKQQQYQAQATHKQAQVVGASRYPQVVIGYQYQHQHHLHQSSENQDNKQLYLSVQYNPSAGWSSILNQRALRAKALALEETQAAIQQQVLDQIHQQLYNFLSAQGRINTLETAMRSARLVQQSYQRQFIAGRKSWLEVMNATREIEQTAYDLSATRSTLMMSYYQLQLLTGALDAVLNSESTQTAVFNDDDNNKSTFVTPSLSNTVQP